LQCLLFQTSVKWDQQKRQVLNRFVPMGWHEFFRSKLVVLSKNGGSIFIPAVPFHVNKTCAYSAL
jgi:hypothetical protein